MQLKLTLITLTLTLFLFNGCKEEPKPEVKEKILIKTKCKKIILYGKIERYTITDWKDYNSTYYLINKEQYNKFSNICKKYKQAKNFYEKQI